ncbi:sulfhydryl oxidase 2 isoform X3 [Telopea speciosissima]|uniref:sulfhydryl oxidase 2 isoform X3 n=1 Tax=Telopea speciosissima TaxID=54955 RepID=UPI001CC4B721|nr:sulfhydryl oxidase 2 isoform X3 [Telopea speciosissima]
MSSILLLFLLLLLSFQVSSVSVGSRAILRTLSGPDIPDAAADLNNTSFDEVLKNSPATFSIVEFFAHWCPACRNYKPHYEKVARLFNGPDAAHPGVVFMARVDCASKINTKLCDRFSVGHYPMLLWGPPSKFASGGWEPKQDKSEIRLIDDGRTADRLLNWINKQLGSSYNLDDEKYENEHLPQNASDPEQIVRAIYDVEEATSNAFEIIVDHKMIKSETRGSLIRFLQLLVAHHPSRRCRKGSAEILVNFDDLWPSNLWSVTQQEAVISHGKDALKSFRICGKDVPRGYWQEQPLIVSRCILGALLQIFCRGSKPDTRGYSCGLWVLLHSLSVRIEDGESHLAFTAICDFIHNFFICQDCRQHFYQMCSSVSSPFNKTHDLALWLWSTHNKVNERLKVEEASLETGDPEFPKIIWPPKKLCPSCYLSTSRNSNSTILVDWNKDEVFKFLVGYYGKMLESSYKDKDLIRDGGSSGSLVDDGVTSTNAVAVPMGAALAIAVASCAFGAVACYWRSQQKNRKYFHHPLKNI